MNTNKAVALSNSINAPVFLSIHETAKMGILSEHHLRVMNRTGRLPGIYAGRNFKVNIQQLYEVLQEESRRCGVSP